MCWRGLIRSVSKYKQRHPAKPGGVACVICKSLHGDDFTFCDAGIIEAVDSQEDGLTLDETANVGGIRKYLEAMVELVGPVTPEDVIACGISVPANLHIHIADHVNRNIRCLRRRRIPVSKGKVRLRGLR